MLGRTQWLLLALALMLDRERNRRNAMSPNSTSKKTPAPASPEATGGRGNTFEDHVVAYWLANLLTGRAPFPDVGRLQSVRQQSEELGWGGLDDALLTTETAETVRIAVSIKSNQQIRGCKAPAQFVKACWNIALRPGKTGFDVQRDVLVLVTGTLPANAQKAYRQAWERARATPEPAAFEALLADDNSSIPRDAQTFTESFRCPAELDDDRTSRGLGVNQLLGAVLVQPFDFLTPASRDETEAVRLCGEILEAPATLDDAKKLWAELRDTAKSGKAKGTTHTLPSLVASLRRSHRLKDHPQFEADLEFLRRRSRNNRGRLRTTIGDEIAIPRPKLAEGVCDALNERQALALIGPPGIGKSVLAQAVAGLLSDCDEVVWLNPDDIIAAENRENSGHGHALEETLSVCPGPSGLLVLDAFEHGNNTAWRVLGRFLAVYTADGSPLAGWKLLLTCRRPTAQFLAELGRSHGFNHRLWTCFETPPLDDDEKAVVARGLPGLSPVCAQSRLGALCGTPKVLDVLASALRAGAELAADTWIGESDVIDIFWEHHVKGGLANDVRAAAAGQRVAASQAEEWIGYTPTSELSEGAVDSLAGLAERGVWVENRDRVWFAHDLYGDYARQRYLQSRPASALLTIIEEKAQNPFWHEAIRLMSLHFLEQEVGGSRWRELLHRSGVGLQGLMFDGILRACQPVLLLERAFPAPAGRDADSVAAFLDRFLDVARLPDGALAALFGHGGLGRYRFIDYEVWLRVLPWVVRHESVLRDVALGQIARVLNAWIPEVTFLGLPDPLESTLLDIALGLAELYVSNRMQTAYFNLPDLPARTCILALRAFPRHPNRVRAMIKEMCGLVDSEPKEPDEDPSSEAYRPLTLSSYRPPWPGGPFREPDRRVMELLLEGHCLLPISQTEPGFAVELLNALIKEPPGWEGYSEFGSDHLGCNGRCDRIPRVPLDDFYPLEDLLRKDPKAGTTFVLQITDFVTDRWLDREVHRARRRQVPAQTVRASNKVELEVKGRRVVYTGNETVFSWHRIASWVPSTVAAILMTFERWLYDQIEQDAISDDEIEALLVGSHSLAVVGLLVSVALRYPRLLRGPLEPLVTNPSIYFARISLAVGEGFGEPRLGNWAFETDERAKRGAEWHAMAHRSSDLRVVVAQLYVMSGFDWPAFAEAAAVWGAAPETSADGHSLRLLAAFADRTNYKTVRTEEGEDAVAFEHPEALRSAGEELSREPRLHQQVEHFLFRCRQLLDGEAEPVQDAQALIAEAQSLSDALPDKDCDTTPDEQRSSVHFMVSGRIHVRCAAAACVAVRLTSDGGGSAATRETARDWLIEAEHSSPASHPWDQRESISLWDWDVFFSEGIAELWLQEPYDVALRRAAAQAAIGRHNAGVRKFFQRVLGADRELVSDLDALLVLGLSASRLLLLLRHPGASDDVRELASESLDRAVASWVGGEKPTEDWSSEAFWVSLHDWMPVANSDRARRRWGLGLLTRLFSALRRSVRIGRRSVDNGDRKTSEKQRVDSQRITRLRGIDLGYLVSALGWLEQAVGQPDHPHGEVATRLAGSLIGSVCEQLARSGRRRESVPTQPELKTLEWAALFCLASGDSAERDRFTLPVLSLFPRWDFAIGRFLQSLHVEALRQGMQPYRLAAALGDCLRVIGSSWGESSRGCHDYPRLLNELGGCSGVSRQLWSEASSRAIETLVPFWQAWTELALMHEECLIGFVTLLDSPAFNGVRVNALEWLGPHLPEGPGAWVRPVSRLLRRVWNSASPDLKTQLTTQQHFRGLLGTLVTHGDANAVSLGGIVAAESKS
jgi:hypothetical protein